MDSKQGEMKEKKVYFIQDDEGKIWSETADMDRRVCIRRFVRDWLSRCKKLDNYESEQVFRIFENNGWEIIELELK